MSNTIEIYCDTCKVKYWFGQGRASNIIKPQTVTVYNSERLGAFLWKHAGHILHTENSDTAGEDVYEYEPNTSNYVSIEDDD